MLEPGDAAKGLAFAVSPARRGFVWRDLGVALLPDTQVFRKRPPRATAAPGRALQSFSDLRTGDYVVHEDHGVAQLKGFETKEVAGVTRDYLLLAYRGDDRVYVPHEQIGKVSRYIGSDSKAPALSKLGGKAWDNLKTRARAHLREMAGELLQLYAQRQTQPGVAYDVEHEWVERLESEFPYRETEDQRTAIEAVMEDLESAASDGQARLRRRRLRQDRGGGARCVRRRRQRQAGADARADDGARAAALEHVPRPVPRLPRPRRDGLALPQAVRRQEGARGVQRRQGRGPDRHAPRSLARRDPEGARHGDRRRGAALRRRAEGAAAPAAARGRRAGAERDADPAHAPHVACGATRHLRDRDTAGRPPPDPHLRRRVRRRPDQAGARTRGRAQRPGVLSAQPGRERSRRRRRSCRRSARTFASSSHTGRCRSASSRTRC